jgi:predicted kinase
MIKLLDLLLEVTNSPKAIFLAGPAGAGKSFISKQLPLSEFKVINIDDTYEELLKASGLGMNQKDFGPDELSKAAKLMAQARKSTEDKYSTSVKNLNNIIIDGTGGSSKPLLKKKAELEALGYKTMMLMIWVSPITSLERNASRDRSLLPSIVIRTWRDINKNIETYKQAFEDDFIIVNNDPKETQTSYDPSEIKKRFFDTVKFKGKEKSPEEQAKSKADAEQLNKDIQDLIKSTPEFDTIDQAKSKVQQFIK